MKMGSDILFVHIRYNILKLKYSFQFWQLTLSIKSERSIQYIVNVYCLVLRIYEYPMAARYKETHPLYGLMTKYIKISTK
jgi:hypothetical protein